MGGANQDERREHGLSRSFIATTVAGRSINFVPRTAAAWGQKKSSGLLKHGAVRWIPEALEVSGLTHRQSTQLERLASPGSPRLPDDSRKHKARTRGLRAARTRIAPHQK